MFLIDAPERRPYPYGLTSVTDITLDNRVLDGHVHTSFCGHGTLSFPYACARVWDKSDTAARESTEGVVFTTLTMESCRTVGYDRGMATDITEVGRSHSLEKAFTRYLTGSAVQIGAGALAPKVALANAIHFASVLSPQAPLIHMHASLVGLVGGIERHGNHLETDSGLWVSAGSGYGDTLGAGSAEVQQIDVTGAPTGGTFTLTYMGRTTTALAYNATAADIQAALEAVTDDSLTVSGAAPSWTVTFGVDGPRDQITANSALTGGTAPDVTTSTTTEGSLTSARIWVTGPVQIVQGVAIEQSVTDPETNTITSINETPYSMSVDCYVAYVDVAIA